MTGRLPLGRYLSGMGLELCCMYLGLSILKEQLGLSATALVLILLTFPLAVIFKMLNTGLIEARRWGLPAIGSLAIAAALLAISLAIRDIQNQGYPVSGLVLQLIFMGLTWYLGNSLVQPETDYRHTCFRFQVSLPVMLFLAVSAKNPLAAVAIYLILTVVTLALARRESSLAKSQGMLQPASNKHLVMAGLAVVVPAAVILLALSPEIARDILAGFGWIGSLLAGLFGSYRPPVASETPQFQFSCSFKPSGEEGGHSSPLPAGDGSGQNDIYFAIIIGLILLLLACLLIRFTLLRVKAKRQAGPPELKGVEINGTRISFWTALKGFFPGLVRHLRQAWQRIARILRRRQSSTPEAESLATAADIYHCLLRWAARKVAPRTHYQTPREYLKLLTAKLPRRDRDLELITAAFSQARYSRHPVTGEDLLAVRKAWQNLQDKDS